MGVDLDVALSLGYNPTLNINLNKLSQSNNIKVKLIRNNQGRWQAECQGANGNG